MLSSLQVRSHRRARLQDRQGRNGLQVTWIIFKRLRHELLMGMKSSLFNRASMAVLIASIAISFTVTDAQADDAPKNRRDFSMFGSFEMEGVSEWFKNRFTEAELQQYRPDDFAIEQYLCNCYDQPVPHFPYVLMFFYTPKGDLVGRPERRGFDMVIIPLAVRHGERYCKVDAEDECYGSFTDPCEFTDFRFGSELAKYFPYCKPEDAELR